MKAIVFVGSKDILRETDERECGALRKSFDLTFQILFAYHSPSAKFWVLESTLLRENGLLNMHDQSWARVIDRTMGASSQVEQMKLRDRKGPESPPLTSEKQDSHKSHLCRTDCSRESCSPKGISRERRRQ